MDRYIKALDHDLDKTYFNTYGTNVLRLWFTVKKLNELILVFRCNEQVLSYLLQSISNRIGRLRSYTNLNIEHTEASHLRLETIDTNTKLLIALEKLQMIEMQ